MLRHSDKRHLAFVLATASLVRIGFLLWSWSGSSFLQPQSTLSRIYFKEGYAIAAGYGYVLANSPKGQAVLDELHRRVKVDKNPALPDTAEPLSDYDLRPELLHPPGMALLVAAVHRTLKISADVPLQILGAALDIAAAGVFWWSVTAFFSARVGLMAGLLYATFPPLASYSVSKEPDGMLSFFVVAALACALKATTKHGWHRLLWEVMAGVCVGIGGYLRPDYILVPVIMFFGLWAYTRCLWQSVVATGVIQVVALLLLVPWAYRNYAICGRWIFTSTSVGGTLVTGLGEFNNPWGFRALDKDREREARSQDISSPWSCKGDRYFQSLFFKSVRQRPGAYLVTVAKRLPVVLATPYDFGFQNPLKTSTFSEARERGEDRYQVLMNRPWYVLAAYWDHLAMAGLTFGCFLATLIMALRERFKAGLLLLLLSPHLYSIGSHILTHLEPRYLLPSMFCWLIGPAYLLTWIQFLQPVANFANQGRGNGGAAIRPVD